MRGAREPVDLRGAPATLLMTLYLRSLDARSAHPALADPWANQIQNRIDYDFSRFRRLHADTLTIATRARLLDRWCSEFLHNHPHGQVLHLGCGLDSRPLRVSPPTTARWVDLDLPEVIELRQRLYELPAGIDTLAASVTDPEWWDDVADDRPTLAVAEGLLMYLDATAVHSLIDRLTTHCSPGQIAFDAIAPWMMPLSNATQQISSVRTPMRWALRPRDFLTRHPQLTLLVGRL